MHETIPHTPLGRPKVSVQTLVFGQMTLRSLGRIDRFLYLFSPWIGGPLILDETKMSNQSAADCERSKPALSSTRPQNGTLCVRPTQADRSEKSV